MFWGLTNFLLNKMASISQTVFSNALCTFSDDIFLISIQISLKFVHKGQSKNKSAVVQVKVRRLFCSKLLPEPIEPMLIQFADVYMRH